MNFIYSLIITTILLFGCSGGDGGEVSNILTVHIDNAVEYDGNLVFNYGGNTYTIVGKVKADIQSVGKYFNVVIINGKPELTN
ncbi:hypothetical protein [Cytobacillus sp. IB215316]|uniref:hypothetical protein n=1 Tax=Cytobacillus sp. IB215316 TaxID=3097354 RepID=UPI002A118AAE|nr:hypothetical protein [Cytobacillus sp. IB215316]MDX8361949.1 hypothetical protein [Cytobacillus sp. IB215316]